MRNRHARTRLAPLLPLLLLGTGCSQQELATAQGILGAIAQGLAASSAGTGYGQTPSGVPGGTPAGSSSGLLGTGPGSGAPGATTGIGPTASKGPSGGLQGGDSGTMRTSDGGFRVIASSFGTQTIAGTTPEDGNQHLNAEERGVALPDRSALGRWIRVEYQGRTAYAKAIDVGPWYTDDPYWQSGTVPKAVQNQGNTRSGTLENGQRSSTLRINGAAIDLTWKTWSDLGVSTRSVLSEVNWRFATDQEVASELGTGALAGGPVATGSRPA